MANVPTTSWSESSPAGTDAISAGDDRIRELKTQIRQVIAVDHDFPSSGQAADNGQHLRVTFQETADGGTGATGVPILSAQTVSGKPELMWTTEADADVQLTTDGKLCVTSLTTVASISTIMNLIYPVGSVVTLGVSTNPGTLFGVGSWTAIEGKVIFGISNESGDEAFDTLNETGGVQTVTLTAAQSGVPAHTHPLTTYATDAGSGEITNSDNNGSTYQEATGASTPANAAEAHTNLPPYIVKYVWERTS